MKRSKAPGSQSRRQQPPPEPLEKGRQIHDVRNGQIGEVLDHACQYAHPKADPVYNYLVRWEDGQVQALSEAALSGGNGYEIVDD